MVMDSQDEIIMDILSRIKKIETRIDTLVGVTSRRRQEVRSLREDVDKNKVLVDHFKKIAHKLEIIEQKISSYEFHKDLDEKDWPNYCFWA
jgi:hypothetical protein